MVVLGGLLTPGARFLRAGLALALLLALVWVLVLEPEGGLPSSCLFHEITGMSCFTCGLTRSLQAVCRGDLQAAVRFHLLGPLVLAGVILAAVTCLAEAFLGNRRVGLVTPRRRLHVLLGAMTVWIAYGVVRAVAELV